MTCLRCIRHPLRPVVRMVLRGMGLFDAHYICPVCGYIEGTKP